MWHWLYHPESESVYYTEDMAQVERDTWYWVDILSENWKEDTVDDLRRCLNTEKIKNIWELIDQYKRT